MAVAAPKRIDQRKARQRGRPIARDDRKRRPQHKAGARHVMHLVEIKFVRRRHADEKREMRAKKNDRCDNEILCR